jgi:signal transduction histidine kinase
MQPDNDLNDIMDADVSFINHLPITNSLLEIICNITGMGFAVIAKVTDKKWIACNIRDEIAFGLPVGGELKLETTICNEVRYCHHPIVIDNVDTDATYKEHPTPAMYGFKSYISVPIFLQDKSFFGTLCAIDTRPAKLNTPAIIGLFQRFTELISFHLSAMEELDLSHLKIAEENKKAEIREQFIAILGHDLRNPVGAIANGAELLTMMTKQEDILRIVNIIKNSANRTNVLIKNMLDFASGRMGGGIHLNIENNIPVEKILKQVICETNTIWPDKVIHFECNITTPVKADGNRLAQLFANLLRNAVTYGKAGTTVVIKAAIKEQHLKLTICNAGQPIAAETMKRLFQPFYRGESNKGQQGLGLGLYIAAEIAKAHHGTLRVNSDENETCFTLTLPQPEN